MANLGVSRGSSLHPSFLSFLLALSLMYNWRSFSKMRHCCPIREARIRPALMRRRIVIAETPSRCETFAIERAALTVSTLAVVSARSDRGWLLVMDKHCRSALITATVYRLLIS